jgi:hypothetical protein
MGYSNSYTVAADASGIDNLPGRHYLYRKGRKGKERR